MILAASMVLAANLAHGSDLYWITGSGNWSTLGNWVTPRWPDPIANLADVIPATSLPGPDDNVFVYNDLHNRDFVQTLTFEAGARTVGSLNVNGNLRNLTLAANNTLTVTGAAQASVAELWLQPGSQLEVSSGMQFDQGTLKGTGSINGNLQLGELASLMPGDSSGSRADFRIVGNLDVPQPTLALTSPMYAGFPGNIQIDVQSATRHDTVQVSGQARLNALVDFVFEGDVLPVNGASFSWLSAGALSPDSNVVGRIIGLPFQWQAQIGSDSASMTVTFNDLALSPLGIHISDSGSVLIASGELMFNRTPGGPFLQWAQLDYLSNLGTFVNEALAEVSINTLILGPGGVIHNRGLLVVSDFRLDCEDYGNCSLDNSLGAEVRIEGNYSGLSNRGRITNAGTIRLGGGAVMQTEWDGTVDNSGVVALGAAGRLVNAGQFKVDGQVTMDAGSDRPDGTVRNSGYFGILPGGSVAGPGSFVQDVYGQTKVEGQLNVKSVANAGRIEVFGGRLEAETYLQTGNLALLQISSGGQAHVGSADIRGGKVVIDAGGALSSAGDFVFDAPLGVLTVNGTLATTGGPGTFVKVLNGVLQGNGLIQGAGLQLGDVGLHTASSALLRPGNSPGTLTIDGALVVGAGGQVELEIALDSLGQLVWDRISASHISFLSGSSVKFSIGDGVLAAHPPAISFFDCGSGCDFASGVSFAYDGVPAGSLQFDSNGLRLMLSAPVPEPQTWALWLAGLAGFAGLSRARRPRPSSPLSLMVKGSPFAMALATRAE